MSWIQRIYNGIFPQSITLGQKEQTLLREMFPTVDWTRVRCYQGLPWYVRAKTVTAMALPSWNGRYVQLHFDSYQNPDYYAITTLVHEAFHVLQYQELDSMRSRWKLSYFRPFMWHYLGWYIALLVRNWLGKGQKYAQANYEAYRYHPLEITAYDHEAAFAQRFYDYQGQDNVRYFLYLYPYLVQKSANYQQRPPFWAWAIGCFLSLLITVFKPLIELVLWGFTRILGAKKNRRAG